MKEKLSLMIIFMIVFLGSQIGATENKTKKIELGKQLFNDSAFANSANKRSCNSCHPEGKGIEEMDNGDYTEMINRCIVGALKGKALEKDSEEMQAMQVYLQSLGK